MHYETSCGDLIKLYWHDGQGACVHGGDKVGHWSAGILRARAE